MADNEHGNNADDESPLPSSSMARQMMSSLIIASNDDEAHNFMTSDAIVRPPPSHLTNVTADQQAVNCTSADSTSEVMKSGSESSDSDAVVFQQPSLPQCSWPIMQEIRADGKLCDVTLKFGQSVIHAHRIVLASTIPYFYPMFTNDLMVESQQDVIEIQTVDPASLEMLINFVYTGKLCITKSNVQLLMVAANFLQMSRVEEACAEYLSSRLTPTNALDVHTFAVAQVNSKTLTAAAVRYIQDHFVEVANDGEFLQTDVDKLLWLLSEDDLRVDSEQQVFHAAVRWLKADLEQRSCEVARVLACVRLPLLTPQFLADCVASEQMIRSSHQCRLVCRLTIVRPHTLNVQANSDQLDEARDYHLMPERKPLIAERKLRFRRTRSQVRLIYVVGPLPLASDRRDVTSSFTIDLEILDPVVGQWRTVSANDVSSRRTPPPSAQLSVGGVRNRTGVTVLGNSLYVIGGYNGTDRLATVEYLSFGSGGESRGNGGDAEDSDQAMTSETDGGRRWRRVADMTCRRSAVGAAELNGRLYVCGGFDGISSLNTVECFDPSVGAWHAVAPMHRHRSAAGVATVDGRIYAVGGHNGLTIFESVEVYDSASDAWSEWPAAMLSKRCRLGVAVLGGRLYAAGGYDGSSFLNSVEVYDPQTNSWSYVRPMRVARSRVSLVATCGKLYAIGGFDGSRNVHTVEIYDTTTDVWTDGPDMVRHGGGVQAAAL